MSEDQRFGEVRRLEDDQVEAFDTEYVSGSRWDAVRDLIHAQFPDGNFSFLDVGGGNGKFADKLLDEFPRAKGTVVDNSELLLSRNIPHERKALLAESVESLSSRGERYDLICIHWVLHHLVTDTYRGTRKNQTLALAQLSHLLTERGRISLYENLCDGWVFRNLPGWLIYQATSTRALARLTRRFGANTGGVGVCFLSQDRWAESIAQAGLTIDRFQRPDPWVWPLRLLWRAGLHLKSMTIGHYWLSVPR